MPKARARVGRHGGYTPARTVAYEKLVRTVALTARPAGWPMDSRYRVTVAVFDGDLRRRDIDNVAKSAGMDALNGVAWRDDSQVDELHIVRTLDRANPRAIVSVSVIHGEV